MPSHANTVVWETHCGSYWSAVFTFECAEPERLGDLAGGARGAAQPPHVGAHPRRHRRPLPDVHPDQVHQGGDVPAHRHVDAQRVHPGRRRRDLRQPAAPLEPDPVFLARADRWRSRSRSTRCWRTTPSRPRRDRVPCPRAWVTKTRPGLANNALADSHLPQHGAGRAARSTPRRRRSSAARSSASSGWSRWTIPPSPSLRG